VLRRMLRIGRSVLGRARVVNRNFPASCQAPADCMTFAAVRRRRRFIRHGAAIDSFVAELPGMRLPRTCQG
jgi:hypothetical protein